MVGQRHRLDPSRSYEDRQKKRQANGNHASGPYKDDEEANLPSAALDHFRSIAEQGLRDKQKADLKRELLEGIDHDFMQNYRKDPDEIKAIKNKKIRQFYEDQNERLNDWLEIDTIVISMAGNIIDSMDPDADHDGIRERQGVLQDVGESVEQLLPQEDRDKRRNAERKAKWAININVIANIALLAAKIVAAFFSSSLSLIASLVDSALDLLCTVIVWTTNKLVGWRLNSLKRRFPVGRRRLEPLGILVFSIVGHVFVLLETNHLRSQIMVISFLQILQESVQKLMGDDKEVTQLGWIAMGAMLATIIVKGIIWFGCIPIKTTQVQALAQGIPHLKIPTDRLANTASTDCKTDVIFNTLSLLFPFIGSKANIWWLDPAGAGILSLFIIWDWAATCFENVTRLSGSAADECLQKKLMYLAYRFSPVVAGFKNVTAYHAGDGVWVEIDLLMDEKTQLSRVHDVSETLQYCCEGLKEVDRAFVTMDYSSQGPSGHTAA
ncbi:MAG: hypothetical protein MMC23_007103 [Stictis urceolatum]|nr:hypothetical protein [Stictis urceolata]